MTWEGAIDGTLEPSAPSWPETTQSWTETAVSIVEPRSLPAMGAWAEAQGYLWVCLRAPGPQHRGRLGLYIEECIEQELEERGALPPGIQASTGLDASLSDQLYRARLVEMRGIALGVPSLEGITNLGRTLDAEDSGVLRWWMAAAADRPVRLVLSDDNMRLRVYPSPVLFETLFEVAPEAISPRVPSVTMAESAEAMALSDLPPDVSEARAADFDAEDEAIPESVDEFDAEEPVTVHGLADGREATFASDVELEELDRALGLLPEPVVSPRDEEETESADRVELTLAPEVPAFDDPPHEVEAAPAEERNTRESIEASPSAERSSAPRSAERSSAPPVSPRPQFRPWSRADETLDAEEFLRVLEEDSARAPRAEEPVAPAAPAAPVVHASPASPVASEPEAPLVSPTLPSPLPTKVIERVPFIRLAEQEAEAPRASAPRIGARPSAPVLPPVPSERAALEAESAAEENDAFSDLARREWKIWMKNLDAARGPKPLAVIERMFVTDYTRLREAVRRGLADSSATEVLDAWQESFQSSYSEAFDALRVRGKRPTMVLDVPELAQRLGRLQGARRVQLLLVDGLRFDLGLMVQERLRKKADAALTERLLLWSALPSITTYQLELLGKGAEGLRESCSTDESPALVARGRAALTPRRIRTGRLELFKLDVVEDALREAGAPVSERLPLIAARTSDAIVDHLGKQPPRTLVLVFGDHGFALDPNAVGTTAEVRQGGASPEEVLVPAFAWLTGAVH